ncbi:hypothetical protein MCEMSE6_00718 [Oxalobacteraceae bacterium]
MARELELLAKEYAKNPVTVLRTNLNLYQTPISTAAAPFLKQVAAQAKKEKVSTVTLVAVIKESE